MKRIFSTLLCFLMLLTMMPSLCGSAQAASVETPVSLENAVVVNETYEELSDDYYVIITTYQSPVVTYSDPYTVVGHKTYTVCNNSTGPLFDFTVNGTFLIRYAVVAECIGVYYDFNLIQTDSGWYVDSVKTSKAYNQAFGDGVFKRKMLGIVVETENLHISLTCDAFGNFS